MANMTWGAIQNEAEENEAVSDEAEVAEGVCYLCFEPRASVRFHPCNHEACASCVRKLRQANIFKPDAGVVCPFCRQPVLKYIATDGATDVGPQPLQGGTAGSLSFPAVPEVQLLERHASMAPLEKKEDFSDQPSNYRTKLCTRFAQGSCGFADRCHFAHGERQLRAPPRVEADREEGAATGGYWISLKGSDGAEGSGQWRQVAEDTARPRGKTSSPDAAPNPSPVPLTRPHPPPPLLPMSADFSVLGSAGDPPPSPPLAPPPPPLSDAFPQLGAALAPPPPLSWAGHTAARMPSAMDFPALGSNAPPVARTTAVLPVTPLRHTPRTADSGLEELPRSAGLLSVSAEFAVGQGEADPAASGVDSLIGGADKAANDCPGTADAAWDEAPSEVSENALPLNAEEQEGVGAGVRVGDAPSESGDGVADAAAECKEAASAGNEAVWEGKVAGSSAVGNTLGASADSTVPSVVNEMGELDEQEALLAALLIGTAQMAVPARPPAAPPSPLRAPAPPPYQPPPGPPPASSAAEASPAPVVEAAHDALCTDLLAEPSSSPKRPLHPPLYSPSAPPPYMPPAPPPYAPPAELHPPPFTTSAAQDPPAATEESPSRSHSPVAEEPPESLPLPLPAPPPYTPLVDLLLDPHRLAPDPPTDAARSKDGKASAAITVEADVVPATTAGPPTVPPGTSGPPPQPTREAVSRWGREVAEAAAAYQDTLLRFLEHNSSGGGSSLAAVAVACPKPAALAEVTVEDFIKCRPNMFTLRDGVAQPAATAVPTLTFLPEPDKPPAAAVTVGAAAVGASLPAVPARASPLADNAVTQYEQKLLMFLQTNGRSHLGSGVGVHCPKPTGVPETYVEFVKKRPHLFTLTCINNSGWYVEAAHPPARALKGKASAAAGSAAGAGAAEAEVGAAAAEHERILRCRREYALQLQAYLTDHGATSLARLAAACPKPLAVQDSLAEFIDKRPGLFTFTPDRSSVTLKPMAPSAAPPPTSAPVPAPAPARGGGVATTAETPLQYERRLVAFLRTQPGGRCLFAQLGEKHGCRKPPSVTTSYSEFARQRPQLFRIVGTDGVISANHVELVQHNEAARAARPEPPAPLVPGAAPPGFAGSAVTAERGAYERTLVAFVRSSSRGVSSAAAITHSCPKPKEVGETVLMFLKARPHLFTVSDSGEVRLAAPASPAAPAAPAARPSEAKPDAVRAAYQETMARYLASVRTPTGWVQLGTLNLHIPKPASIQESFKLFAKQRSHLFEVSLDGNQVRLHPSSGRVPDSAPKPVPKPAPKPAPKSASAPVATAHAQVEEDTVYERRQKLFQDILAGVL